MSQSSSAKFGPPCLTPPTLVSIDLEVNCQIGVHVELRQNVDEALGHAVLCQYLPQEVSVDGVVSYISSCDAIFIAAAMIYWQSDDCSQKSHPSCLRPGRSEDTTS